jgi:hypothetical protein
MNDSKQGEDNVTIKNSQPEKTSATKIKKADDKNFDSKSTQLSNTQKTSSEKNITSSKVENSLKKNQPVLLSTSTEKSNTTITKAVHQNQKIKIANNKSNTLLSLNDNKGSQKSRSDLSNNKKDKSANTVSDNNNNDVANDVTKNNVAAENKPINITPEATDKNNIVDKLNNAVGSLDITKTVTSEKIDSTQIQKQQIVQQSTKKISPEKNKTHFFYAGIIGGGDVSTIEFQSVKNTGFSAGILLGYQLNKKLSVESGFMYDKKFYYTNGKYFSTAKIDIPPYIDLLNVNGDCYMFELPINIKYNWTATAKSSWFSTLGMSSYFMKKENYNYSYEYTAWPNQPYNGSKPYTDSSVNWFGVINLSAGYTHTLGKAGSLRIEPYLKIPLQRLGIGNLSIWSSGIYVSFVKKIF